MSTLFLHIGMPKTGTSYIQSFLHNNNKILMKKGFNFPSFEITFDGVEEFRNGNFLVCQIKNEEGVRNNALEKEIFDYCFTKIKKLFKKSPNVILSDESLWNSSKFNYSGDLWPELLKKKEEMNFDLKVIVYLRRQDLFIQSFWAQQVKGVCTLPFADYINSGSFKGIRLDYYKRLQEIASYVGKENIIVKACEEQQCAGGSLVADFLNVVGLKLTDEYEVSDNKINLTLEGAYLQTKLIMNQFDEFRVRRGYLIGDLKKAMHQNRNSKLAQRVNYFSSYEEQVEFLNKYSEENELVAKEYMGRTDGALFKDEVLVEEDKRNVVYSEKDCLSILGAIISNKSKEIEKVRLDNHEKQEILDNLKDNPLERFRANYRAKKKEKAMAEAAKLEENEIEGE